MKKTSKPILFFGNEKIATGISTKAQIFRGLIESGYDIKALIISQKLDRYTDQLEIVRLAKASSIDIKSYSNLKQSAEEIAEYNVEAAVLAAYGKIVPQEILDIFKIGIINIHPSLLPKHRGPTPIESAILNGENSTGVSIIKLVAAMDAGPIFKQESIKISGNETKQQLADALDKLGEKLLLDCIDDILNGSLNPAEQPTEGITYDNLITKNDGIIDWQEPWVNIERKIRAYSGWPKVRFYLSDIELTLLAAHFEDKTGVPGQVITHEGSLAIFCIDGLVVIDSLIPAGTKQMSGKDFLLGYGDRVLT